MKPANPATAAPPEVGRPPARPRFAALRHRNFTTLWLAGMVSNAGAQVQSVAKVWLIVQLTDSPLALALGGLCFAVPMTLLPPLGGALADRVDRVGLLRAIQALSVLQQLGLAALLATGRAPLWLLYADTVLAATLYAFNSPAQQALLPALVPRADLLNATALQSAVWTGARLIGPALGGALLLPLGAAWLFALNGLSTLAVLAALFGLRDVPSREPASPGAPDVRGSGVRYAWEHRAVRALLALTAGLTLLQGAYMVLLPFFARDIWQVGARGYGLLLSATGAGALLGTFGLAALGDIRRKVPVVGGGGAVGCGALLLFAHAPVYALGLLMLVLVGLAYAVTNAVLATLLQLIVPGGVRGRVMALRSIAFIGLGDFGGLFAAGLVQGLGAAWTVTCAALALLAAIPFLIRQLHEAAADGAARS